MTREEHLEVLKSTLEFLEFCWRDVNMNNYATELLESQIEIVEKAIKEFS